LLQPREGAPRGPPGLFGIHSAASKLLLEEIQVGGHLSRQRRLRPVRPEEVAKP
jgi:hypothetical protein